MVQLGIRKKVVEEMTGEPEQNIFEQYRNGGEGFALWAEDNLMVPIYPEGSDIPIYYSLKNLPDELNPKTGKSYKQMWEEQKEICREALRMENGRFVYRQIVFCWMRGEGKSLLVCFIQLWKFFNWPRQQIMLGANSKDQVKFVHYDIMRELIINSPKLLKEIGRQNIKEKEIRIVDRNGVVRSIIRSISSFSGIVSNITGYTFSEIFDMKNPKFYVQLDGSIRNIPNALGMIDSTVSAKTHILYKLYINAMKGKTRTVFFSYRYSKTGDPMDYWNPNMDEDQLNDYKAKFPFGEFERYFLNVWSAGVDQVFTPAMIEEMKYIGCDGVLLNHKVMSKLIEEKHHKLEVLEDTKGKGFHMGVEKGLQEIDDIMTRFKPVSSIYSLNNYFGNVEMAAFEHLEALSNTFDTDWCLLSGADFGDPYAVRGLARTIFTLVAKGLPGSRTNPALGIISENVTPQYLYILLYMNSISSHSQDEVKRLIDMAQEEFDGVDTFCSERYGAWDIENWCEDRDIKFEPVFPTYERQRIAFKEVLMSIKEGRFKYPGLKLTGSKEDDLLEEELGAFIHDSDSKWFGSPEKKETHGVQDDSIFSIGWTVFGGRSLGVDDFRIRRSTSAFGIMYDNQPQLVARY